MPSPLPRLRLSHGQVLSIFSKVSLASDTMEDEIRYFRRLGVPFIESELGKGRGHRISYNFFHLVELAVALTALRHGMRPREAAKVLIERRARYRRLFRKEYIQQPQKALEAGWVKS
ncbi:MAG: hypothetical protein JWL84_4562, partial [Rhodospirillales bacterium]|nr:hypothetical protein [Rhodospirillales bacterium]